MHHFKLKAVDYCTLSVKWNFRSLRNSFQRRQINMAKQAVWRLAAEVQVPIRVENSRWTIMCLDSVCG